MLQTNRECPENSKLVDYLLGKSPNEMLEQLESHFEQCTACEDTIRGLSATDTLSHFISQAAAEHSNASADENTADESVVADLISKLQFPLSRTRPAGSVLVERAAEVIQLLRPSDQPESLGEIGDYRIEELIGAGSTGVVFRAFDKQLGRQVALKVLRPSLGEAARRRFMSEARAAASIEHVAVVTIYQVGQSDSLAFISMQWLPGQTLEERLNEVTFLPENEVRKLAVQIADGLHAAHLKSLIHRDIKPANIWLCEDSDQGIILDFGLARIADDDPHMTSAGMLAGTPNYMSPEQARGLELDGRSDLFSLGCLMYRASTGKLPFGAAGVLATLQSIQNECPMPPQKVNANLSCDFSDLTMCLLEKNPANRPDDAQTLTLALDLSRKDSPFSTGSSAQGAETSSSNSEPSNLVPLPVRSSAMHRWVGVAVAALILAGGWLIFGQQIIRIATDKGEIVIETDDENVEIKILKGGTVVHVIDTSTQQRIDIEAGTYEITARDPNNANGEFRISNNRVVLERGGREVVSVQLIAIPDLDPGTNPDNAGSSDELVYEGRTFDEWVDELQRERSHAAIINGFAGLGSLSRGDSKRQDRAIAAVTPHVRIHGNIQITSNDDWPALFNDFFSYMPPEKVIDFTINEFANGTPQSRSQSIWFLLIGSLYEGKEEEQAVHHAEIRARLIPILKAGFSSIETGSSGQSGQQIRRLMAEAMGTAFSGRRIGNFGREQIPMDDETLQLISSKLASTHNKEIRAFLITCELLPDWPTEQQQTAMIELIADAELPTDLTQKLYFIHLASIENRLFNQTVPPLHSLYDNEQLLGRLLEYSDKIVGKTPAGVFGFDPTKVRDEILGTLGGIETDEIEALTGTLRVQANIIYRIANRGQFASTALPWLDEIAAGDTPLKKHASIAASQIREQLDE